MKKGDITILRNLKEGDKFYFCDQNGRIKKTSTAYYVEGQYPKFHCTTVFAEMNILHSFTGPSIVPCENVTAVENNQYVKVDDLHVLHVKHTLGYGDDEYDY